RRKSATPSPKPIGNCQPFAESTLLLGIETANALCCFAVAPEMKPSGPRFLAPDRHSTIDNSSGNETDRPVLQSLRLARGPQAPALGPRERILSGSKKLSSTSFLTFCSVTLNSTRASKDIAAFS